MRVLLLRHGESEWNAQGRFQGWGDPPLSDRGRAQAGHAADSLRGFEGRVASSDLVRAHETASTIAGRLGLGDVVVEPGLREIDVGVWTGLTREEIEERYPGHLAEWRSFERLQIESGEHRDELRDRVFAALERLVSAAPTDVVAVTHGGVIHAVERSLGAIESVGCGNLEGRWLEAASPLRVAGDRVRLAPPDTG